MKVNGIEILEDFAPVPGFQGYEINSQGLVRRNSDQKWRGDLVGKYLLPTLDSAHHKYRYRMNSRHRHMGTMTRRVHGCEPLDGETARELVKELNLHVKAKWRSERYQFTCRECGQVFQLSRDYVGKIERGEAAEDAGKFCPTCSHDRNKRKKRKEARQTHRRCRRCRKRLPPGYWMYCPDCHEHVSQFAGMF